MGLLPDFLQKSESHPEHTQGTKTGRLRRAYYLTRMHTRMSNSNRMTARKQAENYHRHCDEVLNTVADRISKKRQQGFDTDEQKMNFVYNIRSEADDLTRSLEAGIVDVEKAYSDVVKRSQG